MKGYGEKERGIVCLAPTRRPVLMFGILGKVARYSFSGSIPSKFEQKLRHIRL